MTGPARVLERRDPIAVREIDTRVRVQEQPHDLLMSRAAVTEEHGFEQSRPAEVVDVVDVDLRLQEPAHGLDVAAVCRRDQRRAAEPVRPRQIGVGAKHLAQHLDIARLSDRQQRVGAGVILEVDVGAGVDEGANDV